MPVDKPKYNGEDNMFFRSNPGMSILPTPEFKQHNLIFFNVEPSATSKWTGQLKHLGESSDLTFVSDNLMTLISNVSQTRRRLRVRLQTKSIVEA